MPEKKDSVFAGWKNYLSIGLTAFLVIAASIAFFFLIQRLESISELFGKLLVSLQSVLIGLVIAYLVHPVVGFFEERFRKRFGVTNRRGEVHKPSRMLATAITLLLLLILLYILGSMVLPEIVVTVTGLIKVLPTQTTRLIEEIQNSTQLQKFFENYPDVLDEFDSVLSGLTDYMKKWMESDLLPLISNIALGLKDLLMILVNVLIGLIVSVYVLTTKEKFIGQSKKLLYTMVRNKEKANSILETARMSDRIFSGFISGTIIKSLILGIACFLLMSLFRLPYAMLVSVVVGVTNVVPFFGPYVGAFIGALLIVLESPIQALYFLILILILQQIDANIIGPKILGNSTGLSSFWVITSILLGGGLFGVLGMLLGVPVFAVFYHIFSSIVNHKLAEKKLPTDSMEFAFVDRVEPDGTVQYMYGYEKKETKEASGQKQTDTVQEFAKKTAKEMSVKAAGPQDQQTELSEGGAVTEQDEKKEEQGS